MERDSERTLGLLPRRLDARLLNMVTLGGAIGTGIFLASGNAISLAGPGGALLAYLITGVMVYFVMSSLGEMAAYMPHTGSFYTYASQFVDPAFGVALAWNYWYGWVITVATEMSASAIVMQFWFPHSSPLTWCTLFLMTIFGFNVLSTRVFGEAEYGLAMIKIVVIILFIIVGFALVLGVKSPHPLGFKNWRVPGAPFHGGLLSLLSAFMIAGFSFQGTELIGIAAGESKNPAQTIPRAIKQVFWRIILFFILSIFVITLLIPYNSPQLAISTVTMSPFTLVFQQYGIPFAASVVNAVVLIALLSTGNSGLYVATRMLWTLAQQGYAPRSLSRLNRRHIPFNAFAVTIMLVILAFSSSVCHHGVIYFWLINAASLSGFIAWIGIAVSHYYFRKTYVAQGNKLSALPFVARGFPYGILTSLFLCLIIIASQNYQAFLSTKINWHNVVISYIGLPGFFGLWWIYKQNLQHSCPKNE